MGESIASSATRCRNENGKRRLPQTVIVGRRIVAACVHRVATAGSPWKGLGDLLVFNQLDGHLAETVICAGV